jgi:hypothetical protein
MSVGVGDLRETKASAQEPAKRLSSHFHILC